MGGLLGLGRVPSPAGVRDGIPAVAHCLPRFGLLSTAGEWLVSPGAGQHPARVLRDLWVGVLSQMWHFLGCCAEQLALMTRGDSPTTAEHCV